MTDRQTTTPAGMAKATVKSEHKTEAAWSALWQEWQRCEHDVDQAYDAEDAAADALPEWAKEIRRKRAGYENAPPDTPAARAAAELDTPEYRAALAGLDAATQRYSDRGDAQTEVEGRILATPAHTAAGALVKLRIGIRDIIINYSDSDGRMPEQSELGMYDRMVLAALDALESLEGAAIGPDEITVRQGRTEIQRLYRLALGVYEQLQRSDGCAADRLSERFSAFRTRIMQTLATGPQDVAVKLRLYAAIDVMNRPDDLPEEGDHDRGWLRTAICDLERLDGEARS